MSSKRGGNINKKFCIVSIDGCDGTLCFIAQEVEQ